MSTRAAALTWPNRQRLRRTTIYMCTMCILVCSLLLLATSISGQQDHCSAADRHENCASGSETPSNLLLDELFPSYTLDEAWEDHPLLSTVYQDPNDTGAGGLAPIDTVVVPAERENQAAGDESLSLETLKRHPIRFSRLLSLFSVDNINDILNQPGISHKDDFLLVRKIMRNGEEWMGQLPHEDVSLELAREAFELGGFSLVINAMQKRWRPIANLIRQVRNETGANYVSVNLYLTPDTYDRTGGRAHAETDTHGHVARRNAFEYHWDWMDVIALQISGTKLWSVSRAPTEYLSPRDMKRKPSLDDVDLHLSPVETAAAERVDRGRYDDFMLRPGDALYIPRGYMHNASTISPAIAAKYGAGDGEELSDDLLSGPSLHLTVGIEAEFQATYEALVHHALAVWGKRFHNKMFIDAQVCDMEIGVSWQSLLHFAVADVARRKCKWGHEDGCLLRRSVPRGTIWDDRVAKRLQEDNRKNMLLKGIRIIQEHALVEEAGQRAALFVEDQNSDEENENGFYVPIEGATNLNEIKCMARVIRSRVGNESENHDMKVHWEELHQLIDTHFDVVMVEFEDHLDASWESNVRKDEAELNKVGQSRQHSQKF